MAERLSSGGGGIGLALLMLLIDIKVQDLPDFVFYPGLVVALVLIVNAVRPKRHLKPLEPLLLTDPNAPDGEKWWNIKVHNPNVSGVSKCYGKVRAYRALHSDRRLLFPKKGTKLPWRASPLGQRRLNADIAGGSEDYLDFAFCLADRQEYYTPQLTPEGFSAQPLIGLYPLPPGQYEAEIEIGAEEGSVRLRVLSIEVEYRGDLRLEARTTQLR